ncbi:hypothetical protein [Nocardia transvalensis]|uniref:hypothetical protein n=1 Tax=Nocardia transvalensis TaxID=37333 RepID=UPI0018957E34|nr:hypothetical protein [Nocardia transvalensis]MBF6330168.1 hypothetical protein [Nocardia transvalensis]
MSVRTRVDAPDRATRRSAKQPARRDTPRRAESAERVKSGAAQRAYARRRNRTQTGDGRAPLPGRAASAMAGRLPFVAGIMALLGCGLALTLLLTTRAAEDSYQLGDARRINRALLDERAALQREVEAADSAPALADRARELGMIPAKDPARLIIAPDGSVTVIGKETPAEGAPPPPLNTSPASPAAPPPKLVQAQGERLVPVTPKPQPPGQPQNPATQAAAGQPAQNPATPPAPGQAATPGAAPAQAAPAPAAQPAPGADPATPGTAPGQAAASVPGAQPAAAPAPDADTSIAGTATAPEVPAPAPGASVGGGR